MGINHLVRWCLVLASAARAAASSLVWDDFDFYDPTLASTTYTFVHIDEGSLVATKVGRDPAPAFGTAALALAYEVVQSESWGGFVHFNRVFGGELLDCSSASEISFWYYNKVAQSAPARAHLRLLVHECVDDGRGCGATDGNWATSETKENHYGFFHVLDDEPGWRRASIGVDELAWTGWSGTADGDGAFEGKHIAEYTLQISIDSQGEQGSNSTGEILVDRLSCEAPASSELVFDLLYASPPAEYGWVAGPGTAMNMSDDLGLTLRGTGAVNASVEVPDPAYYLLGNESGLVVESDRAAVVTTAMGSNGTLLVQKTMTIEANSSTTIAVRPPYSRYAAARIDALSMSAVALGDGGALTVAFRSAASRAWNGTAAAVNATVVELEAVVWGGLETTHSFGSSQCHDLCAEENCNFFMTDEVHCYTTRVLDAVSLKTSESDDRQRSSYVQSGAAACAVCDCVSERSLVNCSSRGLVSMPSFEGFLESNGVDAFIPQHVDYSSNPGIALLTIDVEVAMDHGDLVVDVSDTRVQYVDMSTQLDGFNVTLVGDLAPVINLATPDSRFGDVCCARATTQLFDASGARLCGNQDMQDTFNNRSPNPNHIS